jgi:phage-related tail fiber protein
LASSGGTTPDISIQDGTTAQKGAVQLEDSTSSTSTTKAATPNAVKSAYDLANAALPKAGGTITGDVLLDNQSDLRFGEATGHGGNWVAFQGAATIAANVTWTLPAADGTSGQLLSTNGSGTLSWASDTGAIIVDGGNFANGSSTVSTAATFDGGDFT